MAFLLSITSYTPCSCVCVFIVCVCILRVLRVGDLSIFVSSLSSQHKARPLMFPKLLHILKLSLESLP
jgi:hypothetical protein